MRIEVRGHGVDVPKALRDHATRRVRFALSRFGDHVRFVRIRFEDHNGPKGGVDMECRLQIEGPHIGPTIVQARAVEPFEAVDQAAQIAQRRVRRAVDRWHTALVPPRGARVKLGTVS